MGLDVVSHFITFVDISIEIISIRAIPKTITYALMSYPIGGIWVPIHAYGYFQGKTSNMGDVGVSGNRLREIRFSLIEVVFKYVSISHTLGHIKLLQFFWGFLDWVRIARVVQIAEVAFFTPDNRFAHLGARVIEGPLGEFVELFTIS